MTTSSAQRYQNWPDAVEYKIPYEPPPKGANPAVRGFVLTAGAPLVEKIGFVSKFLYKNAGFGKLRDIKELQDIKQRYDPTVIPIKTESDNQSTVFYTDPSIQSKSLLSRSESPLFYSIRDYHEFYKSGKTTPTIVAKALLPLIRRDVKNRSLHSTAFIACHEEIVLAAAEESTKRWAEGRPLGLLDGVPLAVKDEVDVKGYKKTFASKHTFYDSIGTSWCVKQWEKAGAVIIGKTTMHEIGMDTTNNNPVHGTPLNPYNSNYYTGGSSGGSAYAVAMGLVPVALGCDGGGSIRIPGNYCGVYGLKPSHSRVSAHPSPDLAGTTAVAGPMAIDMDSLAITYRVMATPDPHVSASALFPPPGPVSVPRKKVIGIFRPWYENSDKPVTNACNAAVGWLKTTMGYEIVDIEIPLVNEGQLAHAMTILMEVFNGLGKQKSFLQPANRILMAVGSRASADDFLCAQKIRQVLMQHLAFLFDSYGHDLIIVTPTTPNAGWSFKKADLKSGVSDGDMTIRNMQYVWLANFTGCPAITVPVGYVKPKVGDGNIPVGLMGMGIWGGEEGLIEFGYECEKYLHEVVEGSIVKPKDWVDVQKLACSETNGDIKTIVTGKANGTSHEGLATQQPVVEQNEKNAVQANPTEEVKATSTNGVQ